MTREILETEEIDKNLLDGFLARFEKNSYRSNKTNFQEMDAEAHLKYTFEKRVGREMWTGQISVEVYSDYFQVRGDEALMTEYFNDSRLDDLEL